MEVDNLYLNNDLINENETSTVYTDTNHEASKTNAITNEDNKNSTKKARVKRYCPKPEDMDLKLLCEWNDCNKIINDMNVYLDHIDTHLDNLDNGVQYECLWDKCDCTVFDCESTFKRHVRFHAFHTKLKQIGLNVLESLKTNKSSTDQNVPKCNLDEQTSNVIPELPEKLLCSWDSCNYKTDNPELFYRHIKNEHVVTYSTDLINQKCKWSECEQILANKNRLVEHIRHHSQEKLVACPNCGALFSSFTKFIDHCSRSSEIRNLCFQCSHCNKKFATNNLLKEHIRKHINKCKCPICDMTCIDQNDLSKHILYKHTTHKAFKCPYCEHSSKSQHDLQKHVNLNHNERYEYSCNECEFKTKDLNNMKKHMLKFHLNGEGSLLVNDGQQFSSSYMCHVCNKIYCQGSTLSRHLKSKHNFQWPSGHSRFRYKLDSDGYYRLQTVRYESVELIEQLNKNAVNESEKNPESNIFMENCMQIDNNSISKTPINDQNDIVVHFNDNNDNLSNSSNIFNSLNYEMSNGSTINLNNDEMQANSKNKTQFYQNIHEKPSNQTDDEEFMLGTDQENDKLQSQQKNKFVYILDNESNFGCTDSNVDAICNKTYRNENLQYNQSQEFDFENFLNSNFQIKQQATSDIDHYSFNTTKASFSKHQQLNNDESKNDAESLNLNFNNDGVNSYANLHLIDPLIDPNST